jgi:hypothetical protein
VTDADAALQASQAASLDQVRLRLVDAASDLRPLDGPQELISRARKVADELESIREDLLLYIHCGALESGDFMASLEKIDACLLDPDWRPDAAPVEDVVARLRAEYPTSA